MSVSTYSETETLVNHHGGNNQTVLFLRNKTVNKTKQEQLGQDLLFLYPARIKEWPDNCQHKRRQLIDQMRSIIDSDGERVGI